MKSMLLTTALAALLVPAAPRAEEFKFKVEVKVPNEGQGPMEHEGRKEAPKHMAMSAVLKEGVIWLQDGRQIALNYRRDQMPWPTIEVLEPIGAKVTLLKGDQVLCSDEAPFICKKAGIDDYVKMVVEEEERTWSVKFQAKKGTVLYIGQKAGKARKAPKAEPQPSAAPQPSVHRSRHFVMDRQVYAHGDAVNVAYEGMPGNQNDWVTVVLQGSAPDEWGNWEYTFGKAAGTFSPGVLEKGEYEVRAHYNFPHTTGIQDRLPFTVR